MFLSFRACFCDLLVLVFFFIFGFRHTVFVICFFILEMFVTCGWKGLVFVCMCGCRCLRICVWCLFRFLHCVSFFWGGFFCLCVICVCHFLFSFLRFSSCVLFICSCVFCHFHFSYSFFFVMFFHATAIKIAIAMTIVPNMKNGNKKISFLVWQNLQIFNLQILFVCDTEFEN